MQATDLPEDRAHPRLLALWRIKGVLLGLGAGAISGVLALPLLSATLGLHGRAAFGPALGTALAAGAVASLLLLWRASVAWRVYRWQHLPGEGVVVWQGAWWQREIWIPMARLQHLDIRRGPLERGLGLAALELYTAGSHAYETRLPGLLPQQAQSLRDALLAELQARALPPDAEAPESGGPA